MFLKLFWADLKMLVRNKQSLFWALAFPLIFTCIFGFFFGKNTTLGSVTVIDQANTDLSKGLVTALSDSKLFTINKESDINQAKDAVKKSSLSGVVVIPENFGDFTKPEAPKNVTVIYDPGNSQVAATLLSFVDKFLTATNFKMQNAQTIFTLVEEKINTRELTYYDFVLAGILGLALMNYSIIGISVAMSKYREDQILKRITTTPLAGWKFILAELFSRLIVNFVQINLILLLGVYVFDGHIYGNIFIIYLLAMMGAILFQLIGFVISSLVKTTDAAQGMATAVTIPMMFLSGVFFPIDQLPKWLYGIVQYLPLAPLLRMIRAVALDNPKNFILVVCWIVGCLIVSSWKFRLADE
jgi:ABC-2 type transport system permease protein